MKTEDMIDLMVTLNNVKLTIYESRNSNPELFRVWMRLKESVEIINEEIVRGRN